MFTFGGPGLIRSNVCDLTTKIESTCCYAVSLNVKKNIKGVYSWFTESHSYGTSPAMWDHTAVYLPPDTSERAPT